MDRNLLTDQQWAKMEPHCLGKPKTPDVPAATTANFWRPFFGLRERVAHGVIFQLNLASGIRCSNVTATGSKLMFSHTSSMRSRMIRTWNMPWLMQPL